MLVLTLLVGMFIVEPCSVAISGRCSQYSKAASGPFHIIIESLSFPKLFLLTVNSEQVQTLTMKSNQGEMQYIFHTSYGMS